MLVNGDKLVVKKEIVGILNEGDIVEVVDVNDNGMISFAFGEGFIHKGLMNAAECEEHFEKIEMNFEEPVIREERIDTLLEDADFEVNTLFDKCIVVSCELSSGFVITESYAFLTSKDYNENLGFDICYDKIREKLWELEKYRVMDEAFEENFLYFEREENEDEEEFEDELDEDEELDCEECDDYSCPQHPFNS